MERKMGSKFIKIKKCDKHINIDNIVNISDDKEYFN